MTTDTYDTATPHSGRSDALTRLAWAARQYAFIVVPLLVNVVTIAFLVTADDRRTQTYTAHAVVVATDLELHPDQLPRLAKSVFAGPTVAARVHTDLRLGEDVPSLIPERLTMEPVTDSVVLEVSGRAGDPTSAVAMANTAARVFSEELARAGAGAFDVQIPAEEPLVASPEGLSMTALLVMTAIAGLILVMAILALLVRLRRPLLSEGDVVDALGTPVLGTVALPDRREDPRDVVASDRGVRALARTLAARGATAVVLRGDGDTLALRRPLAACLSEGVATELAVPSVPEEDMLGADAAARWVLVVRHGSSAVDAGRRLRDLPSSALLGVIFARPGRWPSDTTTTPAPVGAGVGTERIEER